MRTATGHPAPARQSVEARLEAFYRAWTARDGAAMRRLFAEDEGLLVWGTRGGERIAGRAELDRGFDAWVRACPPWTRLRTTGRAFGVRGDLAWTADDVVASWSHAPSGRSGEERFRITAVWEAAGGWRIVHLHLDLLGP